MLTTESALRKDKRTGKLVYADGMQHRHFACIAAIIAGIENVKERDKTAQRFADAFAGGNPRFDRARFLRACQP